MEKVFEKILTGYSSFREKYVKGDTSIMRSLSRDGQQPEIMIVACCDSRVDPALIVQCDPGDLFVVRNVANIVPPFADDDSHHGTSAALEFGVRVLKVKHLIILGHSQCGGIQALLKPRGGEYDFIDNWVSIIKAPHEDVSEDDFAKAALKQSKHNCLSFPWVSGAVAQNNLEIHLWFFDIKTGRISRYDERSSAYRELDVE
jgi:carbonic anhydrase